MDAATPVECPRCGYDLSGIAASWKGACPLEGRCSECGLEFEWADVMSPRRLIQQWSFEHAVDRPVRCLLGTVRRAWMPFVLWRTLRMEHPIHARRLALLVAGCLLASHVFLAAGAAVIMYNDSPWWWRPTALPRPPWKDALFAGLWPYARTTGIVWEAGPDLPMLDWRLALLIAFGLVAIPMSFLALFDTMRLARIRRAHLARALAYSTCWLPPTALGVSLLAIVSESDFFVGLAIVQMLVLLALIYGVAVVLLWPVWLLLHWWCFVHRYLRLPNATIVFVLVLLMSVLATAVFAVLGHNLTAGHWHTAAG